MYFFISLKEEIPNKSVSEIPESLPLKVFSSMLQMLLRKIDRSSEKIGQCPHQKHLGIVLDSKLNINAHVDQIIKKCNRRMDLIRRLSVSFPRNALLTIYKSLVRSHLDYGDILYGKPGNENVQNKLEKVQL